MFVFCIVNSLDLYTDTPEGGGSMSFLNGVAAQESNIDIFAAESN